MIYILKRGFPLLFLIGILGCNGQHRSAVNNEDTLGDDFDRSPPFYYKMPENLKATDTSPGWNQNGQKILLTGTVYKRDGKTPAANTILYYYHTDIHGTYATKPNEPLNMPKNKLGQTHGYIRGWVKTGSDGKYSIYTVRPGSYPSRNEPAHVHMNVKEDAVKELYYIDDFVFDDDPLLTSQRRNSMENRCGSGVVRFVKKEDILIGERNLILGLNIPDYPVTVSSKVHSGKNVGEDVTSFTPYHAYGSDKGTKTCPICKYGWYHGILYFVGNNPDWPEIKKWLTFLDNEGLERQEYLKVYFIYGNETKYTKAERTNQLEKLGNELQLKTVALTFVPSFSDKPSDIYLNRVDQNVGNTLLIYRRSNIVGNYVDLKPTPDNFKTITTLLDGTANAYFKLSRPEN